MRRLLPLGDPAGVDLDELYVATPRPGAADRPWVLANMVSSADGGTAVGGLSGPLGGAADRAVFAAIRAVPDVVLVGAGTVRAERYGPPVLSEVRRRARTAAGRSAVPRMAVVTTRLDVDLDSPLFALAEAPPLLLTTAAAAPAAVAAASAVAEVVVAGTDHVDPAAAVGALWAAGHRTVLCEGGPTLLGLVVAAGLVDELCLTIAPLLVAGRSSRIAPGPALDVPATMALAHVLEEDGTLFLRYVRRT